MNKRIRTLLNTHFPLPVSIRGRSIKFGSSIFRFDGSEWAENGVHYSDNFLQLDHYSRILLNRVKKVSSITDSIVDICCGPGRHLNHLSSCGYKSLHGFDIMRPSITNAVNYFPLLKDANLRLGNIIDILPAYADLSFDWAITHTATIENVHPTFRIHHHLYRKVRKGCIFLLNTNGHTYPRNYQYLFESAGFVTVTALNVPTSKNDLTLFTWVKPEYLNSLICSES